MISKVKLTLVIIFTLFMVFSFSYAINSSGNDTETVNTKFRYTGPSANYTNLINDSYWEVADEEDEDCPIGETLPCIVAPDMASITTPEELVEHLEDLGLTSTTSAEQFVIGKTIDWRN